MSILIRDMEMPDSCFHCKLAEVCQHYKAEHYANKRHEDCPLEEVPETHDKRTETHTCDLIDRQALCEYALNQKDKSVTPNDIMRFPSAQPEEDCDTCIHGYFGDSQCDNCRVGYPSHYERRTDEGD